MKEVAALKTKVNGVDTIFLPILMSKNKVIFDIVPKNSTYKAFEVEIDMKKKTIKIDGEDYMTISTVPLSKLKKLGSRTSSSIIEDSVGRVYSRKRSDDSKVLYVFNCVWTIIKSFGVLSFLIQVPATLITLFLIDPITTKKYTVLGLNSIEQFSLWTRFFGKIVYNNSQVISRFINYAAATLGATFITYTSDGLYP